MPGSASSHADPSRDPARNPLTPRDPAVRARREEYWRRNLRYLAMLLVVWFAVSFGFGIVLRAPLDAVRLPGTHFPLGFWFAQQGSIYVFVALIFIYVVLMNRLDREFDVDETAGDGASGSAARGADA
jgi:putative solute:sodium symporter small subunit